VHDPGTELLHRLDRVRIAIVSDFYLDYVGGLQTSIREQVAALEAAGHDVLLISLARTEGREKGMQLRPAWTVPGVLLPVKGATRRLVAHLAAYLRNEHIDVVHVQTEFGLAHAAVSAARMLGIPAVHTVHTFYWQSTGLGAVVATPLMRYGLQYVMRYRISRRRFVRRAPDNLLRNVTLALALRADIVVSPSQHQADDLREAGVERVVAVPNPSGRSLRPAAVLTAEQAAHPRFLWVGRCEAEKRPLVFAQAVLDALARTGDGFTVDFVGDGAELPALRRLVAGHPNIVVHGGLDHGAVMDLIDGASAVALTSDGFDNQPMTIAEATSRYRGVLYCDPKLREGLAHSGHLTSGPDATALADALVHLVTHPADLLELSAGARTDSATFSGDAYVERILAVYAAATGRPRRGGSASKP
jgi:glycosyltransferase involved in cell wall biosynthesis